MGSTGQTKIWISVSRYAGLPAHSMQLRRRATQTSLRVIGDHTRAVVYLLSDGVLPSNVGRGYIVRRLLRRVIVKVFASTPNLMGSLQMCMRAV